MSDPTVSTLPKRDAFTTPQEMLDHIAKAAADYGPEWQKAASAIAWGWDYEINHSKPLATMLQDHATALAPLLKLARDIESAGGIVALVQHLTATASGVVHRIAGLFEGVPAPAAPAAAAVSDAARARPDAAALDAELAASAPPAPEPATEPAPPPAPEPDPVVTTDAARPRPDAAALDAELAAAAAAAPPPEPTANPEETPVSETASGADSPAV